MKRKFGDRLRRAFDAESRATQNEARGELRDILRRREDRRQRAAPPRQFIELPSGELVENDAGICFVRRLAYPITAEHGNSRLAAAREIDRARLAELAKLPAVEELVLEDCLFLDTETTGLCGGAGTVVFMVGMGFFTGDEFVLEQTFLRSYAEERAALTHTVQRLKEHPFLVTFVGKSFDRHRLAARMAVQKLRSPVLTSRHLDLYYMARRAWKPELPNVKLQTVEQHKLAVHREDDLPGSAAPVAFLDWLRDGTGPVDRVFEHNRLDVLSLVTLLATLGQDRTPSP